MDNCKCDECKCKVDYINYIGEIKMPVDVLNHLENNIKDINTLVDSINPKEIKCLLDFKLVPYGETKNKTELKDILIKSLLNNK